MLTHVADHFNSSVQRVIDQSARKKRDVRDDIKYT